MNTLEEFFIPAQLEPSSNQYRKARLFIRFNLVSIAFAIAYFVDTYITGFIMARYTMVVAGTVFFGLLLGIRSGFMGLILGSRIFVGACWVVIFLLSFFSGGMRSYVLPWIALIPVAALALTTARTALLWAIVGVISVVFFFNFDVSANVRPEWIMQPNHILIASLNIGLQFLILVIVYIFERQQHQLIDQLGEARAIIMKQNTLLQTRNEVLEAEISKRTSQLVGYNQQLEQFAFMTSHNLRAPIARLIGLANIFGKSSGAEQELIRTSMLDNASELDQLVRDINSILDIQKGNLPTYNNIIVRDEIELVLSSLQKDIVESRADVKVLVPEDLNIVCIKPYFGSILYNLISNSIKYRSPYEPLQISIQVRAESDFIIVCVTDNGIGIDLASTGAKIFNLYSRFHEGFPGKGIGLYMVKIQSESMGGSVDVQSTPGSGASFTVRIKRAQK